MCDLSAYMDEDLRTSIHDMECPSDSILMDRPWAKNLLESGVELTRKTILIWIKIATVIGDVNVEDYSKRFLHTADQLYADMILDMESLKEKKINVIMQLMNKFESTCGDLQVPFPSICYEDDSIPLCEVYKKLQSDYSKYKQEAEERRRLVDKLNRKQAEFARALGRTLKPLSAKPLPTKEEINHFENLLERLEDERVDRDSEFITKRDEFVEIVKELEAEPILNEYERKLLNLEEGKVATTDADMELLRRAHQRLVDKRLEIANDIKRYWGKIDDLWTKLETDSSEQDAFRENNGGVSLKVLTALKKENSRLELIKRANLGFFVEKLRAELQNLWQQCHRLEEVEIERFKVFHSESYSEDLLDLFEREIVRVRAYYQKHEKLLQTLQEFSSIWKEMEELELNSQVTGLDRYKNRGGKLLKEEKTRNRLQRNIPVIRQKLLKLSEHYSEETQSEFLTFGKSVPEFIEALRENFEKRVEETKNKLSAQKPQKSVTPARSRLNLFGSVADLRSVTPKVVSKRKILTPASERLNSKKFKSSALKKKAHTGNPKTNVSLTKRLSREKRKSIRQKLFMKKERDSVKENSPSDEDYEGFMEGVSKNKLGRSTTIFLTKIPLDEAQPGPSKIS